MTHVIHTEALVEEGILSPDQGKIIAARSQALMIGLLINAVLTGGIIAATAGFIAWLGTPISVAMTGIPLLLGGTLVLMRGSQTFRMFGNAAVLIGGGMLLGGGMIELLDKLDNGSVWVLALGGGVALGCGAVLRKAPPDLQFVVGALTAAGAAAHLVGLYTWADGAELGRGVQPLVHLYAAMALAATGWWLDVRLITALAIVPFAQMLDTGTAYWHDAYVFFSPESTMTILQMGLLIGLCLWILSVRPERDRRHAMITAIMAAVVANLAFLVGSLWGDVPGLMVFGPERAEFDGWSEFYAARDAFELRLLTISEEVYSIVWAILLIAAAAWAGRTGKRGLFNTAMTFGAIHAYTQFFESFSDEPLAYVIGGLMAVPLAWGLWRLNQIFEARQVDAQI